MFSLPDATSVSPSDDYANIGVHPLTTALGAELTGVDLADATDDQFAEVERALYEYKVVFCRDQGMDHAGQDAFTRRFGEHGVDAYTEGVPGHRDVQPVIREADERPVAVFGGSWHMDQPFLERPPSIAILRSVETPPWGGDTLYANTALAYRTLSDEMRRVVDTLRVQFTRSHGTRARETVAKHPETPYDLTPLESDLLDAVDHPMVRTHPVTGERALYVDCVYAVGIKGMPRTEAVPLLELLGSHITQPLLTCRLRWEPNMVAMWDNRLVIHFAMNDCHGFRREFYRTTVLGEVPT